MNRLSRPILAASVLALGACTDRPAPASPETRAAFGPQLKQDRVAYVQYEGRFPALYLANADGTGRTRVRFDYLVDRIEGNYPQRLLPVKDGTIVAMGPIKWSPDGSQLAVVLSVGFDQSQVVVMNSDGHFLRAASSRSATRPSARSAPRSGAPTAASSPSS